MNHRSRQKNAIAALPRLKVDALLVTQMPNIRYLCGFTGSAGVLAFAEGSWAFFTDGRYTTQAREQVEGAKVIVGKKPALNTAATWLVKRLARTKAARIGIESEHFTVAAEQRLVRLLKDLAGARKPALRPLPAFLEALRMIKEPDEVAQLRRAILLGSGLFPRTLEAMGPGVAEATVAADLEFRARKAGAEKMSFDTLVAGGVRSAMPHARASGAPLPGHGFVILDYGVILGGYCSDMTRTVHLGTADDRARSMYHAVLEAQQAAIAAVKPGIHASEVDAGARKALRRAKLEKYFTHSTGHGVGLEIHEPPRLGAGQGQELQPGMVITIEPGAYVPGYGGVRIEDVVLVTERGCEVLTPTGKELVII